MATKKKSRKLGARVSVQFGVAGKTQAKANQAKGATNVKFVRMLESTAKLYGFKVAQDSALTRRLKDGKSVTVRGERSVSIKVPTGKKIKLKSGKTYDQLKAIPVPAAANLLQIKSFLKKSSKKPKYFFSPDGRQHTLSTGK